MRALAAIACRLEGIELWLADLDRSDGDSDSLWDNLSDDERTRADAIRSAAGRRRYIVAHGVLRDVLANRLNVLPHKLRFSCETNGKPYLAVAASEPSVNFNISHSEHLLLIGISCDQRIGVDVERIRADIDWSKLAKRFYSAEENEQLHALSAGLAPMDFFRMWTAKEALLKATGQGITVPLPSVEIELVDGGRAARLVRIARDASEASRWNMQMVETEPGFVASVVCESRTAADSPSVV